MVRGDEKDLRTEGQDGDSKGRSEEKKSGREALVGVLADE